MAVQAMIPPPLTRSEFLVSSHFTIGHENNPTLGGTKSVFKKDYVPWNKWSRQESSVPPKPSEVLHRDPQFFNERASETVTAYKYNPVQNSILRDAQAKLGATNFKMDSDVSKFNSFQTSHNLDYTPKSYGTKPTFHREEYRTVIPQGDREKMEAPISDYRDRFTGHDTSTIKMYKAPSNHYGKSLIRITHYLSKFMM